MFEKNSKLTDPYFQIQSLVSDNMEINKGRPVRRGSKRYREEEVELERVR